MFGPEYPKIQTLWKRDERNVVVPGDWSTPELEYLRDVDWRWTEKVDGTNIRLHWNGGNVTVGGRTDRAQIPEPLLKNLVPHCDSRMWTDIFTPSDNVTVYGEGYGPGIQSGGQYRSDQHFIVFDVLVGEWWLSPENVAEVAKLLNLRTVPLVGEFTPQEAWYRCSAGANAFGGLKSQMAPRASIEGLVGRPLVDLFNRKGERILAKAKVKDWVDYQKRSAK